MEALITALSEQIQELDEAIAQTLRETASLLRAKNVLTSIKGAVRSAPLLCSP